MNNKNLITYLNVNTVRLTYKNARKVSEACSLIRTKQSVTEL